MVYITFKYNQPSINQRITDQTALRTGERDIGEIEMNISKLKRTIYLASKMTLSSSGNL